MSPSHGTPLNWQRPSTCGSETTCAEVAQPPEGGAVMRNSKDPDGPRLRLDAEEWAAFIAAVKAGEFDPGLPSAREAQ